jgi:N6-adenosine-specific RNA methylase IME4
MSAAIPPFSVLAADPPWSFNDRLPGNKRGASSHYACLSLADLLRFPLPPMAPDATLYLWRVAAMVPEAYAVCKAWGFEAKSEIVWVKRTKHDRAHFGMGHYVRAQHEACIIATRGKPKVLNHSTRSVFEAPVGRHSEKPDAFYRIVEELSSGPYVEIFGRRLRPGWTVLGNEVPAPPPAS